VTMLESILRRKPVSRPVRNSLSIVYSAEVPECGCPMQKYRETSAESIKQYIHIRLLKTRVFLSSFLAAGWRSLITRQRFSLRDKIIPAIRSPDNYHLCALLGIHARICVDYLIIHRMTFPRIPSSEESSRFRAKPLAIGTFLGYLDATRSICLHSDVT